MRINISKLMRACAPILLLCTSACSTVIRPEAYQSEEGVPRVFTHDQFDQVVNEYVNDQGRVDYSELGENRARLDQY